MSENSKRRDETREREKLKLLTDERERERKRESRDLVTDYNSQFIHLLPLNLHSHKNHVVIRV